MSTENPHTRDTTELQLLSGSKQEEAILNRQIHGLTKENDGADSVFSYATRVDIAIMAVSGLAAIIAGTLNPILTIIYGGLVGAFAEFSNHEISGSELLSTITKYTIYFIYLAIVEFVFIYIATVGFYHTGERIVRRLRREYLTAVIRQNMAFFDMLGPGEVTGRITSDINLIHEGITSKLSLAITAAATFTTAFVIAFIEYWKLAFILTSTIVAMAAVGALSSRFALKYTKLSLESNGHGTTVANEAISSIRHVAAYGIQKELAQRYLRFVLATEKHSIKAGAIMALMIGVMYGIPYLSYGARNVVTTTLAIVIGAFAIGKVTPSAQAFIDSLASAKGILEMISRKLSEDPLSDDGVVPSDIIGKVVLKNVKLVYPSRQDVTVLKDLSLEFPAGKTTAIVGPSGCGKSSVLGLLERFYEPVAGQIELDDRNIRSLNLRWLRQQVAYINQEPTLFNTTIFENICYGLRDDVSRSKEELRTLVITAAKTANAHDFITALPCGYETDVGERGLQLSGGQRQRIAIARAVVGSPKILLLDEATSSLGSLSESMVQDALDTAMKGRTTIVIAHRLKTIRRADSIIVVSDGMVVEHGRHEDLMLQNGVYAGMVDMQDRFDKEKGQDYTTDVFRGTEYEDTMQGKHSIEDEKYEGDRPPATEVPLNSLDGAKNTPKLSLRQLVKLVITLVSHERWIIITGLFFSIIVGLITPAQSVLFANFINVLSLPSTSYGDLLQRSNFWGLMYLALGVIGLAARLVQGLCFSFVSEKLTRRARYKTMQSIMRQDIGFFDQKEHSIGALTAFLSTGTNNLNSLGGAILGSIFSFIATIGGGIILSLIVGWKLALVCSATIPFVAGCGWVRLKVLTLFDEKIKKTQEESASYANEAVGAIRTVASFGLEPKVLDHYSGILVRQASKSLRSIIYASALYAASQSVVFLCAALGFWYGGSLIASREYTMVQFFICFSALISGSQSAGTIFSFAPDISKALHAGSDLKALLDSRPIIDSWDNGGQPIDETTNGQLEFKDVCFSYPSRPQQLVLDHFNLSIQPGQYIAIVGSSGSGKSTLVSLIERFFNPTSGRISFANKDISKFNVNDYRRMISLVSQETTIYQGTIRENIVLGSNTDSVSDEDLRKACREANILDFIQSLPDGFSTLLGPHGNLLSGGQKQRIANARALLRNPRILLLDEATSALDSESEKSVLEALDVAAKQRTTIAIAHRLSTIQKADRICVVAHGRVIESGTHAELMELRQAYFDLVQAQNAAIDS
ncbi:leptomycin B resistance protein pmd1 [Arthroderma uncinatum]|uniref:leptomycin B resistance protein pmd1 n=1 Tax=Arthroderma uncinatum TaxID=74035 RepID=UPI00144ACD64|nr:leptomycin B resistance protein pmd1 [Arthroderma uncinatum]KAF3482575.1 leptomycin B resistance protein pmd1 [Arthroderma uncinatum]